MKNLKTAIVFFPNGENKFVKYRNVSDTKSLENYLIRKGAAHVNYYCKKSKIFLYQVKF